MEEQHIEDRALLLLESWHGRGNAAEMRLHATLRSAWRLKRELRIPFNEAVSMARDWAKGRRHLMDLEPQELMEEIKTIGKVSLILFTVPSLMAIPAAFFFIAVFIRPIGWVLAAAMLLSMLPLSHAIPRFGFTGRLRRILRIIEHSPHPDYLSLMSYAIKLCSNRQSRLVRPAFKAVLESCRSADLSLNDREEWLRKISLDCRDTDLRRLASEVQAIHRRHAFSKAPHR